MARFSEYDVVKVVRLLEPERSIQGSEDSVRQPELGDVGTVVFVHATAELNSIPEYIVECVNKSGMTVWIADFQEDELESVVYES